MRKAIFLILAVTVLGFVFDWNSVFAAFRGYEDYVTAFVLAALVSPFLAPVFD